MGSILVH